MSREAILNNVKDSLNRNKISPKSESVAYISPMKITEKDLYEEYKKNQLANKSELYESSPDELKNTLKEIFKVIDAKKIICNNDIPFEINGFDGYDISLYTDSVDENREELFNTDTSIVVARCGVANIGVVGLSSNSNAPRLSSLVTTNCIYLLERKNIVENMFEATELIKKYEVERSGTSIIPTNIIFVAGPSRTADIEFQTVFGVHGPRRTFVVFY